MAMEQRLDVPQRVDTIELGVPDLEAARRFYLYGMGWMPVSDEPDALVLDVGPGLHLALVAAGPAPVAAGAPAPRPREGAGSGALTLVLHVASSDEVATVVDLARRVGGRVLRSPGPAPSGGMQGDFADPAGLRWRVTTTAPA